MASVLLLLGLMLAAQLFGEAHRTLVHHDRTATGPSADFARNRLAADVRASTAFRRGSGGSLELAGHPEGTLRWSLEGERLVRTALRDGEAHPRTVLEPVVAWSWHSSGGPGGGVVTARIAYRRGPEARYVVTPRLPPERLDLEVLEVHAHPRARSRWNRW